MWQWKYPGGFTSGSIIGLVEPRARRRPRLSAGEVDQLKAGLPATEAAQFRGLPDEFWSLDALNSLQCLRIAIEGQIVARSKCSSTKLTRVLLHPRVLGRLSELLTETMPFLYQTPESLADGSTFLRIGPCRLQLVACSDCDVFVPAGTETTIGPFDVILSQSPGPLIRPKPFFTVSRQLTLEWQKTWVRVSMDE